MAGIAGIIKKNNSYQIDLNLSISSMMKKLAFSEDQLKKVFVNSRIAFGNAVPVSAKVNDHFVHNDQLDLFIAVEGMVFVSDDIKNLLSKKYDLFYIKNDYELIPYLYYYNAKDFVKHITGWFNIFIYDTKKESSLLINDPLGYLPLYVYDSEKYFIFASKLESILSSGLMDRIEFDKSTFAEHLFFNYPLSDHTYVKNVQTLSNAETIRISDGEVKIKKYWSIEEFYHFNPVGEKQSIEMINEGLSNALNKVNKRAAGKLNLSLTGGWDSRVVLSYYLPELKEKLHLYSFGAPGSDDINVPKFIAHKENIDYTPYILDKNYLDNLFIPYAEKTILLSNGTRNYKRTHYLYAIQQIANISDTLVTGIFGDEVFKVTKAYGGTVLTENTINLLNYDFDIGKSIDDLKISGIFKHLNIDEIEVSAEIEHRLVKIKNYMSTFENKSQQYYSLRFEYNLRKYFGNEVNSYNDFVYCFSPFIDLDFLYNFAHTSFFGIHFLYNSNSLKLKKMATHLYYQITMRNYPPLTKYDSSRGYSMKDSASLIGNAKILAKKFLTNKKKIDGFNTQSTDKLFPDHLLSSASHNLTDLFVAHKVNKNKINSDLNSLKYFVAHIKKNFKSDS